MEAGNRSRNPRRRCRGPSIGDEILAVFINLPEEIVIDILTCLPVKSLLKFRCVSKSWRALISCPSFAESHLQASKKASFSSFTNHRIMLAAPVELPSQRDLSMRSLIERPLIDASVRIDFPGRERSDILTVVGSDNGLICINTSAMGLIVWNPATRVHTTEEIEPLDWPEDSPEFGFGYSKATDDYKVLGLFSSRTNLLFVKIYSLKDRSWKRLEEGYNYFFLGKLGGLLNGKLHFGLSPAHEDVTWKIVSIDLDSGTQGIIEQPDLGNNKELIKFHLSTLGVLDGRLCVLFSGYNNMQERRHCLDLWVLKDYRDKESWTKLFTIHHYNMDDVYYFADLTPLIMLPTGEILLLDKKPDELAIYNPRDDSWTFAKTKGGVGSAVIYVESLVSPLLNAN